MRKYFIILLCCTAALFAACKRQSQTIIVMWYLETEQDSVSSSRDAIIPIQQAFDYQLTPLGDWKPWENPNFAFSHMVISKSTDIEAVRSDAQQAARMAHLQLGGDAFALKGWAKCIQYVTIQQDGYPPIPVFSHDYSK